MIETQGTYCESLANHYRHAWRTPGERREWNRGPRGDLPPGFGVFRFARSPAMWACGTVCMSEEQDEARIELHLLSPVATDDHVELLTAVAHYHRTGSRLGVGHTVNFGRPWLPGSQCSHGLVSLPYLDGPDLEILRLDGKVVRFLWLIPITKAEVEYKKKHGLEALEAKLEEAGFAYLDPQRASVV